MTTNQLAYLTLDRLVAWKCLSVPSSLGAGTRLTPVAYASRSPRLTQVKGAHLWIFSCPRFETSDGTSWTFPPTLTARIVVEKRVEGDKVRGLGTLSEASLEVPPPDTTEFDDWRRAKSITDERERAIFRITRDFALIEWKARTKKKRQPARTMRDAWRAVNTAVATGDSAFFPYVNASEALSRVLDLPAEGLSKVVGKRLMAPWTLPKLKEGAACLLPRLLEVGKDQTAFLSYRWTDVDRVARMAMRLLRCGRGVWLDRLAMPGLESRPSWQPPGEKQRRKDPPPGLLEALLCEGIRECKLFVSVAGRDFATRPRDGGGRWNWAQLELDYAEARHQRSGRPVIQVVHLDDVTEPIPPYGEPWRLRDDTDGVADQIARALALP